MPTGVPKTDNERKSEHEAGYGEGNEPPLERRGLGAYRFNWRGMVLAFLAGLALGFLLR